MKKNIQYRYRILAGVLFILAAQALSAKPLSCKKIDCDCVSIPNVSYQNACLAREARVKSSCKSIVARGVYCSIHGPSAQPVAIAMPPMDVDNDVNVDDVSRVVVSLFRSATDDQKFSASVLERFEYKKGVSLLRLANKNIDSLFLSQLTVSETLNSKNDPGRAKASWRSFSKQLRVLAKAWYQFGRNAEKTSIKTNAPAIMIGIHSITSKMYEYVGFAYSESGAHVDAAKMWEVAAGIAKAQVSMLGNSKQSLARKAEINSLIAGRLHRASYYWLLEDAQEKASSNVLKSLLYRPDATLLEEILRPEPASLRVSQSRATQNNGAQAPKVPPGRTIVGELAGSRGGKRSTVKNANENGAKAVALQKKQKALAKKDRNKKEKDASKKAKSKKDLLEVFKP